MKNVIVVSLAICLLSVLVKDSALAGWDPAQAEHERMMVTHTRIQSNDHNNSLHHELDNL